MRELNLRGGTASGVVLDGYESFKAAPLGTVAVQIDGFYRGKLHVKTHESMWGSFFGNWAEIPELLGRFKHSGVSPCPPERHEIVTPPKENR